MMGRTVYYRSDPAPALSLTRTYASSGSKFLARGP